MYSLDINFLKDRPNYQNTATKKPGVKIQLPVGNMTPLYIGVAVGICLPTLVGGAWWWLQAKNSELEQNLAQLDQESKRLDTELASINKIKEETTKIKGETQGLVTVFDQIRPWSAMLQDLRERIPANVQIEDIKQTPPIRPVQGQGQAAGTTPGNPAGGIEINGVARSFNDVNDFLLTLQQSHFLKASESKIKTAELVNAPSASSTDATNTNGVKIPPPQVVKYTIQSSLSDVPASELIRELEQKGTVGLVTRIRSIQKTGVITK
ncbi:Fimbrial assembly [Tolypothrix tenuis PCC 7101]|uniref:Fimbrial assembly n=1 Tax=Tolypothrix tenuis PCC 7101 TaxID=231146 RepID=A0A1Z4MZ04_9CYAN|nr:PilN domain-containing protein [Aulosira sp. FACHB-113]BAY98699.1 Fimbrial assembly [Tolypothrix tenuis PCC 7101]BAZ77384.1 Fimbrial assembly [Aulosira laxa NIES-50]